MRSLQLDVTTYTLENGLRVILHPDNSVPIVAVNIWYHVGSKDESRDRTGLAHLFEHLMFEGSANYDQEYFKPLQEAGGSVNGSTSHDRTNYYEVVPSNFLELALWLEADRMGHLLPALTQAKLDNQRAVVKNERRQRVENQPYGLVPEETARALYPPDHPYSWPVIGYMEHLEAASLKDVHAFFRRYYQPGNATLALSGSFDEAQARKWIDDYFGPIPPEVTAPPELRLAPSLTEPKRVTLEDAVALPRLDLVWPTQPRFSSDEPAMDFAAAILAGHSKDSRLKRRLIHDEKLVTAVGGYHHTMKLGGQFVLRVYGLPQTDLKRVEEIVLEEIHHLHSEPPSEDEVERVRNHYLNEALSQVETALGKANTLNHYLFYQGSVDSLSIANELATYLEVTPTDIQAAARRWLGPNFVAVQIAASRGPHKASSEHVEAREKPSIDSKHLVGNAQLPGGGPQPTFHLPTIQHGVAANGVRILLVERHKLPKVEFQLLHSGGSACELRDQLGLARLTAEVLDESTLKRSGLELARELDQLGVKLGVSSGIETGSLAFRSLTANFDPALELAAEVLLQPAFHQTDLDRERGRLAAELAHRAKQPSSLADDAIDALVYGADHPYGRPSDGTIESIVQFGPEDLRRFHQKTVHPAAATIIAVGPIGLDELTWMVEKHLGHWQAASEPLTQEIPDVPLGKTKVRLIDRQGAAQSVVRLGRASVPRSSPEYFPLLLLNTIVGGQFASRLNLNLREEKGYTYGARSAFYLRRQGGAFIAGSDVQGTATADAVREMLREILGPARDKPITPEELAYAKAYLCRRFPGRFETSGGIAAHLAQLAIYDLPDDFYDNYMTAVSDVTLDQVNEAARKHLNVDGMHVVVVGDPAQTLSVHDVVAEETQSDSP